jgi:hypothetical protein
MTSSKTSVIKRSQVEDSTTTPHEHGSPAEIKPDTAIHTHRPNTLQAKPNQGPKLYSKGLAIEPNRLL